MMMQALAAGGIPPLTDRERVADDDNPRGYLELEAVKRIAADAGFLSGAEGRAVKMIHALVTKVPAGHQYRVLFMRRPLPEVVASQAVMLQRAGRKGGNLPPEQMQRLFEKQVEQTLTTLRQRDDVQVLQVDYPQVVADPGPVFAKVNAFLGSTLDEEAMRAAVDPSLHRNRGG